MTKVLQHPDDPHTWPDAPDVPNVPVTLKCETCETELTVEHYFDNEEGLLRTRFSGPKPASVCEVIR